MGVEMAVRLTLSQRESVRREIAGGGVGWWTGALALSFAAERRGKDRSLAAVQYQDAILRYRGWLIENYRTVRAQARAA